MGNISEKYRTKSLIAYSIENVVGLRNMIYSVLDLFYLNYFEFYGNMSPECEIIHIDVLRMDFNELCGNDLNI